MTNRKRTLEEIAKAVCGTIHGPEGCPGGYGDGPCPDCSEILAALREAADAARQECERSHWTMPILQHSIDTDSPHVVGGCLVCDKQRVLEDSVEEARQEEREASEKRLDLATDALQTIRYMPSLPNEPTALIMRKIADEACVAVAGFDARSRGEEPKSE